MISLKTKRIGSDQYVRPAKTFTDKLNAIKYERYLKSLKGGNQLDIEIEKMFKNADVAQLVPRKCGAW